ncbi:hypothetical protein GA0070560_10688 [Micromonospora halophytica]|uniref:Uncharacterized protein n=1 Tax=Micromonospora halophytica TaxID=47864 RepID=A0A1C5HV19_9ACTN|nr:hypothetical protein GA0070560_10688 [Micromonospora halophytica]
MITHMNGTQPFTVSYPARAATWGNDGPARLDGRRRPAVDDAAREVSCRIR